MEHLLSIAGEGGGVTSPSSDTNIVKIPLPYKNIFGNQLQ